MKKSAFLIFLSVILKCWICVGGDTTSCLSMSVFAQTYSNLQSSVESLLGQMSQMKSSLDSTIAASCGEGTTIVHLPPFNITFCDFEDGRMCNYTQDKDDNSDLTLAPVYSTPDQTIGDKTGHYVRNNYASQSYHGRITSPVYSKSSAICVRFFYKATAHPDTTDNNIKVYVKQPGGGHGYPVLDLTKLRTEWQLAELDIDPEYLTSDIQLQFEINARDYAMIDDISVYNVHCTEPGIKTPFCGNHTWVNGTMKSCYTFHIEPRTWREAVLSCKKEWPEATLVAIETAAEQKYLVNTIKTDQGLSQTGQFGYWTTGNDVNTEGAFVWSGTHEALTYTNWHLGQPNNVGGNQNCLLLQYAQNDYEWGDVDCTERHPFICEKKYSTI